MTDGDKAIRHRLEENPVQRDDNNPATGGGGEPHVPPRPSTPLRKRAIAFRVIALLFPVALILGAEALARGYVWAKYGVPGKAYGLWQADAELGAIHALNGYNTQTQTNNWGFRGTEDLFEPKPAGSLRVVCYGGSTTFCYNLPDGETWPEQLQAKLRAEEGHEQDQVLNGGHICWSSAHLLARARRELAELKPDLVILYTGVNEEMNARALASEGCDFDEMLANQEFERFALSYDQCRWLKRNSVLVRMFDYKIRPLLSKQPAAESNDVLAAPAGGEKTTQSRQDFLGSWKWQNYRHNITEFEQLVKNCGATLLFVVEVGAPKATEYLRYSAEGLDVMSDLGVDTCDPRGVFAEQDQRKLFYHTGVHLSSAGANLLASEVLEAVLRLDPRPRPAGAPSSESAPNSDS